ncbi:MAG: ABC transporter permease [Spirochaetales bacterium]|nr:ABC transporter permease [Spirochaetales bacterium]
MNIEEGIRQSFDVLRANKARSLLTMLGINFGVLSLVAISIIGLSFRGFIGREMAKYGSEIMWVFANNRAYARGEPRTQLDGADVDYFRRTLPGLQYSTTFYYINARAVARGRGQSVSLFGVDTDYFQIFAASRRIAEGRALLPDDDLYRRPVCVVGPEIAGLLFGAEDPMGKRVSFLGRAFTVVGVTAPQESTFVSDGTDDTTIFVPQSFVAARIFGGREKRYYVLLLKFSDLPSVDNAVIRMENYLEKKYGLLRGEKRFRVMKFDTFIQIADNVLNIVSLLVLVISAISLLVGGLGIMNIMLVTVTERTQEIGMRMAVGARRRDVLSQFLIEAVVLCLLGGFIGAALGAVIAAVACTLLAWPFIFSLASVVIGLAVATAIGILFGLYPAWKASRLTPIEALRVEV